MQSGLSLSDSLQDYLEGILNLSEQNERVRITDLANHLGITKPVSYTHLWVPTLPPIPVSKGIKKDKATTALILSEKVFNLSLIHI